MSTFVVSARVSQHDGYIGNTFVVGRAKTFIRVCEMHFAVKEADRYQTMANIFISSLDTCDFLFSIHIHIYCSIHKRNFKEF